MILRNHHITLLLFILLFCSCTNDNSSKNDRYDPKYLLRYEAPASFFEETLVLGNGKMGASVFGGTVTDSIYLNDATLWSGEPVNPDMNPDAHKFLPQVREALKNENYEEADQLIRNIQGSFSHSFAPLGTIYFTHNHPTAEVENYQRKLDISDALALVDYQIGGVNFEREYFVSNPDKVMVIRLSCDSAEALNFTVDFSSLLAYENIVEGNVLRTNGYAPYHCEPNYRGDIEDPVLFDENRGIHFSNHIKVNQTDGAVSVSDGKLSVSTGSYAEIIVSTETSFNGYDKDPVKEGKDYQSITETQLQAASGKAFEDLKREHLNDYHSLFNRMSLRLQDEDSLRMMPTDERLIRHSKGSPDKGLEELYFHFGRYLMISSSRTPEVPANLQGIWNPYLRPPWSSNYTVNINVEENYWLAEAANLSECHYPLLSWIENLAETGQVTAKNFYGAGGWTVGHNSEGHPVWANWNMGGAWLSTHLWEHYQFNPDEEFLQETAYPLMKGAAEFCLDMLVKDEKGNWVTSPGTSPENLYKTPNGYVGATLYGATADLAFVRELFANTIKAASILNIDVDFQKSLAERLAELRPYQVSQHGGGLLEWYHDWEDADPQHRHQTHLFGLHPGHHITVEKTPRLAEACKATLNIKGDKSTGWSQGWRINLWARLKDGERAYQLYRKLLNYVDPSGLNANYANGGGTYPNLFDAHPPFQIDGNFGGAAGVIEMILHSFEQKIELLPAIPDVWSEGEIHGVRARGGYELSFKWENKKVTDLSISAKHAGSPTIIVNGKSILLTLEANEKVKVELE